MYLLISHKPRALRAILRTLFRIVCSFLIFARDAAARTGHTYVIRGLIIDVYIKSEQFICSVELLFVLKGVRFSFVFNVYNRRGLIYYLHFSRSMALC